MMLVPWVIPLALSSLGWWWLFDPTHSAFNYILSSLGFSEVGWLSSPYWARFSVILVNVWFGAPFFLIMYLAALKSVPEQLYEAAAIDGANAWQKFLHITLPMMRNIIAITVLFSLIVTFASARSLRLEVAFRVAGRVPEIWHPDTGRTDTLALWREEGGRTFVPLDLDPCGSLSSCSPDLGLQAHTSSPRIPHRRPRRRVRSSCRNRVDACTRSSLRREVGFSTRPGAAMHGSRCRTCRLRCKYRDPGSSACRAFASRSRAWSRGRS